MNATNLRKHKKNFVRNKKYFRSFITRIENKPPENLESLSEKLDKEVWKQIDCMNCANCCKVMSPTYTFKDIKRIAVHFGMRPKDFKEKWLYFDNKEKDWMNKSTPCQFLELKTNRCTIYQIRPADCASFPHLVKRPITDYMHVHKQNIEYCPATMVFVEKMMESLRPK
jgi:Fe-S-cluster containining protein